MYVVATNLQMCHNCKFISELWGKCQNCEIKSCNNFFVYIYIYIEMGLHWVFFQILCKTWGYKVYRRYNDFFLQQDQDLLAVKWHLRLSLSSFQHVYGDDDNGTQHACFLFNYREISLRWLVVKYVLMLFLGCLFPLFILISKLFTVNLEQESQNLHPCWHSSVSLNERY